MDYVSAILEAVGPIIQAASTAAGKGQQIAGQRAGADVSKDIYKRAIALLEGGGLDYTPATASGIQRPVGDQGAMAAQQDALWKLQEAARNGYNVVDRAAINAAINQTNQNARGQREAILARMDPRSGAALAAQLQAQQGAANQASQQAMDIAAGSRAKALAALGQYGSLAGHMRDQEFKEQNAIDTFNANIGKWNAGQTNEARAAGIRNKVGALGAATGAGGQYADALRGIGLSEGQLITGLGSSVAGGFDAWSEYQKEQQKKEEEERKKSNPSSSSNV